jgi:protein arginine kinase activator
VIPGFSFNDLLSAFYENEETEEVACEVCGTTLSSFKKTGKLGCAQCYKTFEPSLLPVLKGIHMNERHIGKHPGKRVTIDVEKESKSESRKQ